jgi:hypothetical protein
MEGFVLKTRHFFVLTYVVLLAGLARTAAADIPLVDTEANKLSLYGWIKGDGTYQDDDMNSKVAPRFAVGDGDNGTNLTAMHSRFGLKWNGPMLDNGWNASAVFEFDLFDSSSNNQMKFRDRLAAFTIAKDQHSVLIGQHWDIFSPLGPTTLMTNGYLWQTGNMGFRRAQARYTYKGENFELAGSINDPSMSGESSETDSPLFEGRVGFGLAGLKLGVSGTYGQDDKTLPDGDSDIWGLSADLVWPISSTYSVKGEIAAGENLANFLSRSKVNTVTGEEQETLAGWAELTYTGTDFDWWAGGAFENVDDAQSAQIDDTWMMFAGVQWKMKSKLLGGAPVRLGVEVAHFDSSVNNGSDSDANQIIFSGQYTF